MPAEVRLDPAAEQEARAAFVWYLERNAAVADAFEAEFTHAISAVASDPERWPRLTAKTRRYVFPRYPFSLIYTASGNVVDILAVAHHRRKPGYWRSRER